MTIDDGLRSSQYWRDRAEEARAKAGEMRRADVESAMLDIAAMYDRMAKRAEEREGTGSPEAAFEQAKSRYTIIDGLGYRATYRAGVWRSCL